MTRPDDRAPDELRPVTITRNWLDHAEGSVLVEFGRTRVLCAASVTVGVPRWRRGSGLGWVTAEYAMLPRSTHTRSDRESVRGKIGGRTHEISRLIGRALRASIDLAALGENSIAMDCDVLQADGGTRTAAITGAYVALADAVSWLSARGSLAKPDALHTSVAAVSVGVVDGEPRLDLEYVEDVAADTDMNVVCTGSGDFIEVQGTAEGVVFDRATLDVLLDLAVAGCATLTEAQHSPWPHDSAAVTLWRLVLATRNQQKLIELRRILAPIVTVEVVGLDDLPPFEEAPEVGATFAENALAKARDAAAATGLPAVADDSGLAVDALNGMPGVLSARWSGRHGDDVANLELLLAQIADIPAERRGAAFVCAAALVVPGGPECVLDAEMRGILVDVPRGVGGFGYDPIFVPEGHWQTTAEVPPAVKDAISHRGRAFRALAPIIADVLG